MALDQIAAQLATAAPADLAQIVAKLGNDIDTLRTLAETGGTATHTMATALIVRAHQLVVTATELLIALPDV
jgi:hypothetical protein